MEISAPVWLCFYLGRLVHVFSLYIFIGIWLFAQVLFHVNNGAGRITVTYEPRDTNSLCDGKWHKLQANKSKHSISLIIDGNLVHTDNPYVQSTSADTNNPIYVGGYPGRYKNISLPFCPSCAHSYKSDSQYMLPFCLPWKLWLCIAQLLLHILRVSVLTSKAPIQSGFLLCFSLSSSIVPWQELLLQTLPS